MGPGALHHLHVLFIQAISIAPLRGHYYTEAHPTQHYAVSEFHAEAPQTILSERLVQGPYVAARAGFEPDTIRTKGAKSTNEPPSPIMVVTPLCLPLA